jgi:tetratricopeptide (TPR) repeat protein
VPSYEDTLQCKPESASAYLSRGELLYRRNRYREALAAYEQAIRFDPEMVRAYYGKAEVLYGLNHYREALDVCEHAIHLASKDPESLVLKGWRSLISIVIRMPFLLMRKPLPPVRRRFTFPQ